jgi:hypothetical protein
MYPVAVCSGGNCPAKRREISGAASANLAGAEIKADNAQHNNAIMANFFIPITPHAFLARHFSLLKYHIRESGAKPITATTPHY